ncbi:FAD-dependent oxidoreductase [Streptomyces viridosporus]
MTDIPRENSATRARWQTCLELAREPLCTARRMTGFHLDVSRPEGPVHFAGEHASLKHTSLEGAWIEGAPESAVRAAVAVHQAPPVTTPGPGEEERP